MDRTCTLPTLLLATCALHAQLAPQHTAPLRTHLQEVNAYWAVMDPAPQGGPDPVAFHSEAERIATHLRLVERHLRAHTPEGIPAAQADRRAHLLDALDDYAERGRFPQNHVLPFRNPVFIDPYGTACAVGQLMIASGHRDLAERIDGAQELAYVADLLGSPELGGPIAAWAAEHGFTADELAWIQPGYPPTIPWNPLGTGTDSSVTALLALGNGGLLLAGAFTTAGGVAATRVALWDGASYSALGSGVSGAAECAVAHNGMLYLGGSFEGGMADLAVWDGSAWSYTNVFPGMWPRTHALHVHNGVLHAAGEASGFAGTDDVVRRLVNGTWEPVGSPFNATVTALATHNGQLVAGGAFTTLESPLEPVLMHCATLGSGDWQNLALGLDAPVRTLLGANDTLYAGGDLWANIVPTFGLARLAPGATTWEALLPGHAGYMPAGVGPTFIGALAHHGGKLYFGGTFTLDQMMLSGAHIGRFHGTPDAVEPLAWPDAPVRALATTGNALVMGGDLVLPHAHVATTDLSVGLGDGPVPTTGLHPSPTDAVLEVRFPAAVRTGTVLRITDAAGRTVADHAATGADRQQLDVRGLAPGTYWLSVGTDGRWRPAPFTKH
ncbi:MAG: T9SS type A sorting domain-containing protein [Flavobacteriales bacterium]|nr:hypothetical protein [Flavobacteriales bacterium]MCC6576743.1 T9SS type A sorting domain-containing protein [Flavobacteriales bacterium]